MNTLKRTNFSLWLKISYTLMVLTIIPIYWREYGPSNFLWFSDIALISMTFALWFEHKLIPSMMIIGVAPIDFAWTIDFMAGGHFFTQYMFDASTPLYLRGLSLFHVPLPFIILYCVYKLGYDKKALLCQAGLIVCVLLFTYSFAPFHANINWVHGWGEEAQTLLHPWLYLVLLNLVMFSLIIPMHFLMKKLFAEKAVPSPSSVPSSNV